MTTEDNMNQTCTKRTMEEPKYFLLWIALWIGALLALLPMLGRA
jgi:hypothetical protein